MSSDRFDGDEINVEGLASEHAARFPYEDAAACRAILKLMAIHVEAGLAFRAERDKEAHSAA